MAGLDAEAPPPGPAPFGTRFLLDDAAIGDAFLDAVLGRARDRTAFEPWRGVIRPIAVQPPAAGHQRLLSSLLQWLQAATDLRVSPPGTGPASLGILFSRAPLDDLGGPFWTGLASPFFADREGMMDALGRLGGCFTVRAPAVERGLIVAPASVPADTARCLSVSLLGLLGLRPDLAASLPSVLADGSPAVEPTALDRLLAGLATAPELRHGMNEAEMREVLPACVARQRRALAFDPMQRDLGRPDDSDAGNWFEPSAARTLAAFEAVAVPARGLLLRWPRGAEIPVHVAGSAPPMAGAALRWSLGWIAAMTGLRLRNATHVREDGITVLISETLAQGWEDHGPRLSTYFGGDRGRFEAALAHPATQADGALTILHHGVPGGVLQRSVSLVSLAGPEGLMLRRICRELLRATGLRGGGSGFGHSLFDDGAIALQPSDIDARLARLVYSEEIQPGMAHDDALASAARLLGREAAIRSE